MKKGRVHFELSERKAFLRVIDNVAIILTLYGGSSLLNSGYFNAIITKPVAILALVIYINLLNSIFELYDLKVARNKMLSLIRVIFSSLFSTVLFILTPYATPSLPSSRLEILYFFMVILIPLLLWRTVYIFLFAQKHRFVKQIVLVCDGKHLEDHIEFYQESETANALVGYYTRDNYTIGKDNIKGKTILRIDDLETFCKHYTVHEIIVCSAVDLGKFNPILLTLMQKGINVVDYACAIETTKKKVPLRLIGDNFYQHFPVSRSNYNRIYVNFSRLFDVIFALFGLFFTILFVPFIWIGNMLANKGPLFYGQERVGRNGNVFKILKFRSMVEGAEARGAAFAQQNDMRITTFGKLLRKTRLDELPQLINILRGDMAVVGPRPERPIFVNKITEQMPFYPVRHAIKPGLTGWAQISFRYGSSIEDSIEKLCYDLYYIKHRNLFLDVKIVIKTVSTVLFFKGQ